MHKYLRIQSLKKKKKNKKLLFTSHRCRFTPKSKLRIKINNSNTLNLKNQLENDFHGIPVDAVKFALINDQLYRQIVDILKVKSNFFCILCF
jgi:hypothetical protein